MGISISYGKLLALCSATLTATAPVFGLVMAVFILKEQVTVRIVLGTVLCVTGVWLVL